jgi:uncharacterized CHY-type Zn-finger protein
MSDTRPHVNGIGLDAQTRCAHYSKPVDVIAIKMKCCDVYYACKDCHDALAGHAIEVWPRSEWDQTAILCGACGTELTIRTIPGVFQRVPSLWRDVQSRDAATTITSTSKRCSRLLVAIDLSDKESAEAHVAQTTSVSDRAAVRHNMGFHSWIERKALGFLRFYDPFVFPEYFVIEIVDVLHRQIGIEVPCDRREETCHFSGYRRGGIHNRHAAFAWKMNHERCGEGRCTRK